MNVFRHSESGFEIYSFVEEFPFLSVILTSIQNFNDSKEGHQNLNKRDILNLY